MSEISQTLNINMFGSIDISIDDSDIATLSSKKAKALLVYLVLHEKPQTRYKLSALLWTEAQEEFARTNLRQALSSLRKCIDDNINLI